MSVKILNLTKKLFDDEEYKHQNSKIWTKIFKYEESLYQNLE